MDILATLLLFLLPFERLPSFEVSDITIRLSSLLLLSFLGGIAVRWLRPHWRPWSAIDKAIGIFYGAMLLSVVLSEQWQRSLFVSGFLGLVLVGYFLISRTYRRDWRWEHITRVTLWSAGITAAFGLFQFFGDSVGLPTRITGLSERYTDAVFGFARIQSVGLEPLYYANFLLWPILVLVGRNLRSQGTWQQDALLMLLTWVFLLTLSRGAFLALGAGLIALGIIGFRYLDASWRQLLRVGTIMLISVVLAVLSIFSVAGSEGLARFRAHTAVSEETRGASTLPRLARYEDAWRIFTHHPVTGVGLGSYGLVSELPKEPGEGIPIVNNQYLESLAETGLMGFVALIFLGIVLGRKLWRGLRAHRWESAVLGAVLVAIAVQYNFFSTIYLLFLWVIIGLIDALPVSSDHKK